LSFGYSFFLILKQFEITAIPFAFKLIDRNEAQGGGIDTVAQTACFPWAIREYVAQMTVAVSGTHFGSDHAMARVALFNYVVWLNWGCETWPATAAVEFVNRCE
jgi:hypothetical protein